MQQSLYQEVYLSLCKDTGESPTKEGLEIFLETAESSPAGQLVLPKCRLGPTATITLLKRLEGTQLTNIDLFGNVIRGVGMTAVLQTMKMSQTVERLDVGNNDIGPDAIFALAEDIKYDTILSHLELGSSRRFYHPNCIGTEAVAALADGLLHNQTLRYLGLNGNDIGGGNKAGCGSLSTLIARNKTIETLGLSDNNLDTNGIVALSEGLAHNSTLRTLHLADNGLSGLALANYLGPAIKSCSLQYLNLARNPAHGPHFALFCANLRDNAALRVVNFRGCGLGAEGANALCTALASCMSIQSVDLTSNGISAACTSALVDDLLLTPSLTDLKLAKNPLGNDLVRSIAAVIPRTELKTLDLTTCRFGGEAAVALARAAAGRGPGLIDGTSSGTVTSLKMGDNHIDEVSGSTIAQIALHCSTVLQVDITGNQVSHGAIRTIKQACARNKLATKHGRPQTMQLQLAKLHSSERLLGYVKEELEVERQASSRAKTYVGAVEDETNAIKSQYSAKEASMKTQVKQIEQETDAIRTKIADKSETLKATQAESDAAIREAEEHADRERALLEADQAALEAAAQAEIDGKADHEKFMSDGAELLKTRAEEMEAMEAELADIEAQLATLPKVKSPAPVQAPVPALANLGAAVAKSGKGGKKSARGTAKKSARGALKSARSGSSTARKKSLQAQARAMER